VTEKGITVKSSTFFREKILHIIIEEDGGKDRERESYIARQIFEKSALAEYGDGQNGVADVISPTQNNMPGVRSLVKYVLEPSSINKIDY
jgi:hypothetical protein